MSESIGFISDCKMKKEPGDICPCTLEGVLSFLGKSWNIMIIGSLGNYKKLRYNQLLEKLGAISPKTLAKRLKELEGIKIIERKAFAEIPPRVEYNLSDKGRELYNKIIPLMEWALTIDH